MPHSDAQGIGGVPQPDGLNARATPSHPNTRIYNERMSSSPTVDLVGVGLNATDTLIRLPEFPQRGSKLEFRA